MAYPRATFPEQAVAEYATNGLKRTAAAYRAHHVTLRRSTLPGPRHHRPRHWLALHRDANRRTKDRAMKDPFKVMPWWKIIRWGEFRFYWFPGVSLGIYRDFYDGWMLAINLGICSFEWTNAWEG